MTPERWQQVKEIFHSAIGLEPEARRPFLDRACGGDESLREEIESLIAAHEQTGSFIDSPAFEAAAELFVNRSVGLKSGQQFGPYEIIALLGEGGMGQVYLAKDKRLGRKVALKLLPTAFTQNADRLRRFLQEARAASALNHPNILTIYETGEINSLHFIAAEYVEGRTLRERMGSARISLSELLPVAVQMADALSAAHKAGIIHRDIKPENVMLREDGLVKVLDFGLAKLAEGRDASSGTEAPTLINTTPGMVMGTAAYMSPEQARGDEVDARTDIWSLGCVLYEMLAGRAPFEGATASHLIVSILEKEPQWTLASAAGAPAEFEWIVRKALRKDRDERYQTAKELLGDLRSLKQRMEFQAELERTGPSETDLSSLRADDEKQPASRSVKTAADTSEVYPSRSTKTETLVRRLTSKKAALALALAALVLIAASVAYRFLIRREAVVENSSTQNPSEKMGELKAVQVTTSSGLDMYPSFSPDGNSVAYCSDHNGSFEIYVKQLAAGGREIQLTSDGRQNLEPAWSPDGKLIAYQSRNRGIWVVPALGGTARQVTDFGARPAWSRDGAWIAFQSGVVQDFGATAPGMPLSSTIWVVAAEGGEPKQITQAGSPAGSHGMPAWSPDGKRIIFVAWAGLGEIWSMSAQGSDLKRLAGGPFTWVWDPVYSADGKSIYYSALTEGLNFGLWQLRLSPDGEPLGEPIQILNSGQTNDRNLAVSADGKRIAYSSIMTNSNIWSLPVSPSSNVATGAPVPLTNGTLLRNSGPSFSPDGRKIAYVVWHTGQEGHLGIMDADGKNAFDLTPDFHDCSSFPSWFPNGKQIAFVKGCLLAGKAFSISVEGGRERLLLDLGQEMSFMRLSPDGKWLAFNSQKDGVFNVWVASLEEKRATQLTFDKELMGFPYWSPDGQFIAFEMQRGEDSQIMIMPSTGGPPTQLTSDHGLNWTGGFSPDGDKILFVGQRDGVWNLWWVSRSTKAEKKLTNYTKLNAYVRYPVWSPLGDRVVYEYAETAGNIWLLDLK